MATRLTLSNMLSDVRLCVHAHTQACVASPNCHTQISNQARSECIGCPATTPQAGSGCQVYLATFTGMWSDAQDTSYLAVSIGMWLDAQHTLYLAVSIGMLFGCTAHILLVLVCCTQKSLWVLDRVVTLLQARQADECIGCPATWQAGSGCRPCHPAAAKLQSGPRFDASMCTVR